MILVDFILKQFRIKHIYKNLIEFFFFRKLLKQELFLEGKGKLLK